MLNVTSEAVGAGAGVLFARHLAKLFEEVVE